jgi:hypothetical protein
MPIVSQVLDAGVILAPSRTMRSAESTRKTTERAAKMYLAAIAIRALAVRRRS